MEAQNDQLNAERARFSLKCVWPDFLIPWFRCGESDRICGDYRVQSILTWYTEVLYQDFEKGK